MNRQTVLLLSLLITSACSADPVSSDEYLALEQRYADAVVAIEAAESKHEQLEADYEVTLERLETELATESATIPDGAIPVTGTSECIVGVQSYTEDEGGDEIVHEQFRCETVLSDERATGTEQYPVLTLIPAPGIGGLWTIDGGTLVNGGGTWRTTGHGLVDMVGISPLAEGVWPFNYGEVDYVGEGAYEGLTMHLYISGTNFDFALAGWIEERG